MHLKESDMWVNMVYKANIKLQPAFLLYVSHFISFYQTCKGT